MLPIALSCYASTKRSPLPRVAPGHCSHGATAGASVPTKGHLLGSQTEAAAGATAAPALYFPSPISPISASWWRLVMGAGDGDMGVAPLQKQGGGPEHSTGSSLGRKHQKWGWEVSTSP